MAEWAIWVYGFTVCQIPSRTTEVPAALRTRIVLVQLYALSSFRSTPGSDPGCILLPLKQWETLNLQTLQTRLPQTPSTHKPSNPNSLNIKLRKKNNNKQLTAYSLCSKPYTAHHWEIQGAVETLDFEL